MTDAALVAEETPALVATYRHHAVVADPATGLHRITRRDGQPLHPAQRPPLVMRRHKEPLRRDSLLDHLRLPKPTTARPGTMRAAELVQFVRESLQTPPLDGESIKTRREALNLSQRDLARESGYSRRYLAAMEEGTRRPAAALRSLARTLERLEAKAQGGKGDA